MADSLPHSLIFDLPARPPKASKTIASVLPTTSNSVGPNQLVSFNLPSQGFWQSHSTYLKFKASVTTAQKWSFAGIASSAAAFIDQIMINCGGQQISFEQLWGAYWNNNILLAHAADHTALNNASISEGAYLPNKVGIVEVTGDNDSYSQFGAAAGKTYIANPDSNYNSGAAVEYTFCIPIRTGFFANKDGRSIPLCCMPGPITVNFYTAPVSRAFNTVAADATATYTLSEFELIGTRLDVEQGYIDALRAGLNSGKVLKLEMSSYLALRVGAGPSVRQQVSVNMSSLDAILYGLITAPESESTSKWFQAPTSSTPNDPSINESWFIDERQIWSSPKLFNVPEMNHKELVRAIAGSLSDHGFQSIVSAVGATSASANGSYVNCAYAKGLSTKLYNDEGVSMGGSPAGTVSYSLVNSSVTTSMQYVIFLVYSMIVTIDRSGAVAKFM